MKTTLTLIISLVVLPLFGNIALAHTGETGATETLQEGGALDLMEHMSEEMMGRDAHIRMEELMTKLIAGDLSSEEQDKMIAIMQDAEMGSGAMIMMMQMMGLQMMNDSVALGSSGMMGSGGMMGGSFGVGGTPHASYWITMSLVWAVLMLGIAALWKWLNKGR